MKLKCLVDLAFVVKTSHNAFIGHCFYVKVIYILQHFRSRQSIVFIWLVDLPIVLHVVPSFSIQQIVPEL